MCPKPTPKPTTAPPVRITNAACPRCGGPVYWCRARWVFCRTCPERLALTPAGRRAAA